MIQFSLDYMTRNMEQPAINQELPNDSTDSLLTSVPESHAGRQGLVEAVRSGGSGHVMIRRAIWNSFPVIKEREPRPKNRTKFGQEL